MTLGKPLSRPYVHYTFDSVGNLKNQIIIWKKPATNLCDKPPKVLEWSGKSYHLIAENTTSEPGMKYGFMKCDKGKFTLGDADNAFTVYSVGNPKTNNDIIFTGNWGSALYSIDANAN